MKRNAPYFLLLFFSAGFLLLAASDIKKPFTRGADAAGWTTSTAVIVRAMIENNSWIPYGNGRSLSELNPLENIHALHPHPLFYWMQRGIYQVIGFEEWKWRLIPLICTFFSGLLLFWIGASLWNPSVGWMAAFGYFFHPSVIAFGMSNTHQVLVVPFFLLALIFFYQSKTLQDRIYFILSGIFSFLAASIFFQALFLPVFFAGWEWRNRGGGSGRWRACVWLLVPILAFAVHLCFYYSVYPHAFAELMSTAWNRSGLWNKPGVLFEPFARFALVHGIVWTLGILMVSFFCLVSLFPSLGKSDTHFSASKSWQRFFLLAMAVCPSLYILAMSFATKWDFLLMLIMLAPWLGLCFAVGMNVLLRRVRYSAVLCAVILMLQISQDIFSKNILQNEIWNRRVNEPIQVGLFLNESTEPGAVIFEEGGGKRVFAYYAPGRTFLDTWNFLLPQMKPADYMTHLLNTLNPNRPLYLLRNETNPSIPTMANPHNFEKLGMKLDLIWKYQQWAIYKMRRSGL